MCLYGKLNSPFEYQGYNNNKMVNASCHSKTETLKTANSQTLFPDIRQSCYVILLLHCFQLGSRFDTRSGRVLLFPLPLIQEGHLSVTCESKCTEY